MRNLTLAALTLAFSAAVFPASAQMSASDLVMRIEQLENQLRQVTGTVEQLQYRNQQLEQQVRKMQEDTEYRFQEMGGRGGATAATAPGARPVLQNRPTAIPAAPPQAQSQPPYQAPQPPYQPLPGRRSDAFDPSQNPGAPGAPRTLGNPSVAAAPDAIMREEQPVGAPGGRGAGAPLDLSMMAGAPASDPGPRGEPYRDPNPSVAATLPPTQSPRDEFDLGYGYIQRKDYALAEQTLRGFLSKYPSDRMVPEAQYWLGESLFQRQRYNDAAENFLQVATKYETAGKAPDSLLRLGQSLAAMGNKETACATFGEVTRKYPRASLGVKQGVEREQRRVKC